MIRAAGGSPPRLRFASVVPVVRAGWIRLGGGGDYRPSEVIQPSMVADGIYWDVSAPTNGAASGHRFPPEVLRISVRRVEEPIFFSRDAYFRGD